MNKKYSGKIPTKEGWTKVGSIDGEVGRYKDIGQWDVYYGPISGAGRWMRIKLVTKKRNSFKANYHLVYGLQEQRFAKSRERGLLEVMARKLAEALADFVMNNQPLFIDITAGEAVSQNPGEKYFPIVEHAQ